MSKEWRKCPHCNGNTTCGCGTCRVYLGDGYDNWERGVCSVCHGERGWYVDKNTGRRLDGDNDDEGNNSDRDSRRR